MPGRAGAVAVAPDNYGTLWMTTPARAYRSQDGGHSWKTVAGSAGGGAIAFGEKHTYLYGALGARVGPFTGLVVRPFRPAPEPLVAVTSPYYVTHRLYALDGQGGLWLSVNVGRSWAPLRASGLPVSGVAVAARRPDTARPDTIYVAAGPAGLWKSTDSGASFQRVEGVSSATAVATSTPHNEVLLVADAAGLLHSANDGRSFSRVLREPGITALAVDTRNPQNAFAGTAAGLLLRSDDGGVSWSR